MGFFDNLDKANKTINTISKATALVGGSAFGVTSAIGISKKNKHKREMDNKMYDLEVEKLRSKNDLEIRKLEQKERMQVVDIDGKIQIEQMKNNSVVNQMQLQNYSNLQLQAMKNDAMIQQAKINSGANVQISQQNMQAQLGTAQMRYGSTNNAINNMQIDGNTIMYDSLMFVPLSQQNLPNNSNVEIIQRKLLDLNELRKSGVITDEEFIQMRQQILSGM